MRENHMSHKGLCIARIYKELSKSTARKQLKWKMSKRLEQTLQQVLVPDSLQSASFDLQKLGGF